MKEWVIQSRHGEYDAWSAWSIFWYEDGGPHAHWFAQCEDGPSPLTVPYEESLTRVYWARTLEDCIRIYAAAISTRIQIAPFRFYNMNTGESFPTDFVTP